MSGGNIIRSYEGRKLAQDYERYRPGYPSYIADTVMDELRKVAPENSQTDRFDRMLDVACGTGQSTHMFKSYFKSILGIDISAGQISIANEKNISDNIEYKIVHDNFFPVDDESIDLITCATAAHFLDRKVFTEECNRVLKPNGCAVIYTYCPIGLRKKCLTDGDSDSYRDFSMGFCDILISFTKDLKAYHPNYHVLEKYANLFEEIKNNTKKVIEAPSNNVKYTLLNFLKMWSTVGEYRKLMDEEKPAIDPLQVMENRLKELLGVEEMNGDEVEMICYYPMLFFQKQI